MFGFTIMFLMLLIPSFEDLGILFSICDKSIPAIRFHLKVLHVKINYITAQNLNKIITFSLNVPKALVTIVAMTKSQFSSPTNTLCNKALFLFDLVISVIGKIVINMAFFRFMVSKNKLNL